jgi:ABC-type nitrate/sulfonate/bicarbonate transport system permease component
MSKPLRVAVFYLPIFAGLALWEIAALLGLLDPSLFPSLGDVLTAFVRLTEHGHLVESAGISLFRQSSGFFLAAGLGVLAGMLMAESRVVRNILEPLLRATFPLPKSALIPLFILWLGIGDSAKVAAVFLGCLLPIVVTTFNAARGINKQLVWSAWSLGTPGWAIPWKVVLPAALPEIMSGLRIALALSFTLMVSAEFLIGQRGLGFLIGTLGEDGDYAGMFAAVLAVTLLGFAADRLFLFLSRRVLAWQV